MKDYNTFITLNKLFHSLILEKHNIEGEIKVMDFTTDTYVDFNQTKDFPTYGGIHVIIHMDLTKYHIMFDTYDDEYAHFFDGYLYDDLFEKILKYVPSLPLYHEFYFKPINKDKLIDRIPEMIENINSEIIKRGIDKHPDVGDCRVSNIIYESKDEELTKHGVTRMYVKSTCNDVNVNGKFSEISSSLYEDMLWLSTKL